MMTRMQTGLVSIVASVTIGGALWWARTDKRTSASDLAELKLGVTERALATQWRASTNTISAEGYYPIRVGNEAFTYWATDPAHPTNPVQHHYATVEMRGVTNTYPLPKAGVNGSYFVIPPAYDPDGSPPAVWQRGLVHSMESTNRYIIGPYSNLTVSGLTGWDGTYYRTTRADYSYLAAAPDSVEFFTNATGARGIDYSLTETRFRGSSMVRKQGVPWLRARTIAAFDSQATVFPDITATGLDTNHLIDAALYTTEPYYGQAVLPRLQDWEHELGGIDSCLSNLYQVYAGYYIASTNWGNEAYSDRSALTLAWTNFTGQTNRITPATLTARYNAIHALDTSLLASRGWVGDGPSNVITLSGIGTNWAEAVASITVTQTTVSGSPFAFASTRTLGGAFRIEARARAASLSCFCNSNTANELAFYALIAPYTNAIGDALGETLTVDASGFHRFDTAGEAIRTGAVSRALGWVSEATLRAALPVPPTDDPASNYAAAVGWMAVSNDVMARWGFRYCTVTSP